VSTNPSVSFAHLVSQVREERRLEVRYIGLDVHREFCEVAISQEGKVRSAGRVRTRRAELELFAQSLGRDDEVALESTGGAQAIAGILRPWVARVVVVNTKKLRQISEAKAKTDRLDARRLAELLAAGFVSEVWCPDEQTRGLRRWVARRAQLVRQRSRAKNEIAAALARNLLDRAEVYDLSGKKGRRFLEGLELPADERQTVAGCLRQIDFLDQEIAEVDRALAEAAVDSEQMRRLMSVPGVNLHTAATFMACVGDIGRFKDPRKLVSYLGLDPKVRQSGSEPVRYGHISKEGASEARHMLCEAAWVVVRYPSPLRAFGQRIAARRGAGIATVAVARKLVVLFWHLLTKQEDYAFQRASLTQRKLRRLELHAGAERRRSGGRPEARRSLTQGEATGRTGARPPGRNRLPAARLGLATDPKDGRGRDTGTRISRPSKRQAARQGLSPKPCALARRRPRPRQLLQGAPQQSRKT
jgi:transposase